MNFAFSEQQLRDFFYLIAMRKRQSERELMITNIQASVQGEVTQALSSPFNTTMTMYRDKILSLI